MGTLRKMASLSRCPGWADARRATAAQRQMYTSAPHVRQDVAACGAALMRYACLRCEEIFCRTKPNLRLCRARSA